MQVICYLINIGIRQKVIFIHLLNNPSGNIMYGNRNIVNCFECKRNLGFNNCRIWNDFEIKNISYVFINTNYSVKVNIININIVTGILNIFKLKTNIGSCRNRSA